jgi:hypothetical protein
MSDFCRLIEEYHMDAQNIHFLNIFHYFYVIIDILKTSFGNDWFSMSIYIYRLQQCLFISDMISKMIIEIYTNLRTSEGHGTSRV